jgi:hypothetical protein
MSAVCSRGGMSRNHYNPLDLHRDRLPPGLPNRRRAGSSSSGCIAEDTAAWSRSVDCQPGMTLGRMRESWEPFFAFRMTTSCRPGRSTGPLPRLQPRRSTSAPRRSFSKTEVALAGEVLRKSTPEKKVAAMFVDSAFGAPIVERLRTLGFDHLHKVSFGAQSRLPRRQLALRICGDI